MSDPLQLESLGDYEYMVRFTRENDSASFQLRATPEALGQLPAGVDEARAVREAVMVLAERQPVADLPPVVDLVDVVAKFPDFREALGYRLGPV